MGSLILEAAYATQVPAGSKVEITVTLQGGNYAGTITGTYRILAKDHDISKAIFQIAPKVYTDGKVELVEGDITKAQLKVNGVATHLVYGADYEIAGYEKNMNKGTAKVTFKGIGEFGGEKTVTFKIGQRDVVKNWVEILMDLIL